MSLPDLDWQSGNVVYVAIPSDCNIRKENKKLKKCQGLKEEMDKPWQVHASVVPVITGALSAVTPKLKEWLQIISGTTSEISAQRNAVLETSKILQKDHQTLRPQIKD